MQLLASEEDVADVIHLYTDFFNVPNAVDAVALQDQQPTVLVKFGERRDGKDPGVEVESSLTPEDLSNNLGFVQGLPLLFSTFRHRGGFTAWDSTKAHLFDPSEAANNQEMGPIALHWHQLAGVHAIIRSCFSPKPNPGYHPGMLIADEVGLGKTFQSATTIAVLSDLILRQQQHHPLPPIISEFLLSLALMGF